MTATIRAGVLLSGLLAMPAGAYPIAPVTLWELTDKAQLIVVAKVVRLHDGPTSVRSFKAAQALVTRGRRDGSSAGSYARLHVLETLKGDPATTLDVETNDGMICPAPGRFDLGERVLAFLRPDPDGTWEVVGLSYGTLYPDDEELAIFRERIAAALALRQTSWVDSDVLAWKVQTASRRATRWHGLYAIAALADRMHAFYDPSSKDRRAGLSAEQRRQIAEGFIAEPSADSTVPMVAQVLVAYRDPRLDRALIGAVDALLDGKEDYVMRDAIAAVIERAGGKPAKWLGKLREGEDFRFNPEELQKAWMRARADLKLPEGTPVARRSRFTKPVGPDTPP
jgi:hypothetical protein